MSRGRERTHPHGGCITDADEQDDRSRQKPCEAAWAKQFHSRPQSRQHADLGITPPRSAAPPWAPGPHRERPHPRVSRLSGQHGAGPSARNLKSAVQMLADAVAFATFPVRLRAGGGVTGGTGS